MSWFQNIIVMPIVIGYLAQLLIKPDGGLGTFSQLRQKKAEPTIWIWYSWKRFSEISELPKVQQDWFKQGQYITLNGYKMFYRTFDYTGPQTEGPIPTIALVHGYPSSSFDYHKVRVQPIRSASWYWQSVEPWSRLKSRNWQYLEMCWCMIILDLDFQTSQRKILLIRFLNWQTTHSCFSKNCN